MRIVSGLKIAFGVLTLIISVYLAIQKRYISSGSGLMPPSQAPYSFFEIVLLILGFGILIFACVEFLRHVNLAIFQIICGLTILIVSIFLLKASFTTYSYSPGIYWLVFVNMAAALFSIVVGFVQFLKIVKAS